MASLVAQLVKNPPAMWETWVRSLGWEDPLGKGKMTHSSILAWRIPWTRQSMGSQSQTRQSNFRFHVCFPFKRFNFKNCNKIRNLSRDYIIFEYNKSTCGNLLVVQWLRFGAFTAMSPGFNPWSGK